MNAYPQTDIFRHSPERMAQAYRTAAETAAVDPHYTPEQRAKRQREFLREAERIESTKEKAA